MLAAFELGSAVQVPLGSFQQRADAKAELRTQIRASRKGESVHPAITAWIIGNEPNGPWQLYVCKREYARSAWALPEVDLEAGEQPRCQFDEDPAAFMRVLDELCGVVKAESGLPCSTALAGVSLPGTNALWGLPQYRDGALGWMTLMDGSSPEFTLHNIDMWCLNLYPGRSFDNYIFDEYAQLPPEYPQLPILVTEYGVDAFNTDAWYERCGGLLLSDEDKAVCTSRQEAKDAYWQTEREITRFRAQALSSFVDEAIQADWVLSLTESLERYAVTCTAGCAARVVSGGAVLGWMDEYWKGRVIDSQETDIRSAVMSCPDIYADQHSTCGYPNDAQPDTFVNEEWFGLFAVVDTCPKDQVDQLKPRAAWFGLKALWTSGGCTPQVAGAAPASYDVEEYPGCGSSTAEVRRMWLAARERWLQANASTRAAMAAEGTSAALWIGNVGARAEAAAHGDGACEIQQLVHEFDPTLCPVAPAALLDWVNATLESYANRTDLLFPSVCDDDQLVDGMTNGALAGVIVAGLCVLGLFVGHWERLILCRRRSKNVRRIVSRSGAAGAVVIEEAAKAGEKVAKGTKLMVGNTMAKLPVASDKITAGLDKMTGTVKMTAGKLAELTSSSGAAGSDHEESPDPRRRRLSLMIVRTGSGPTGFGGLKDATHATELVEVVAARALLLPVAQRLATLFGFQTTHGGAMPVNRFSVRSDVVKSEAGSGEVPSNVANTVETLAALLGAAVQRLPASAPERHLATAVAQVHARNTANYARWMARLGLRPRAEPTTDAAKLHQLVLWYLIWGEASNLRHLPECLCLILYCASNALALEGGGGGGDTDSQFRPQLPKRYQRAEGDGEEGLPRFPHVVPLPAFYDPFPAADGAEAAAAAQSLRGVLEYRPGDFLASVVTPIYKVLRFEIQQQSKAPLAERRMYDDVNEFFLSRANVDALLKRGTNKVDQVHSHQGYAALRARLGVAVERGDGGGLQELLHKTFTERPGWAAALYGFRRVILLNAVALHAMLISAIANVLCEHEAKLAVPDFTEKALRRQAEEACLRSKYGDNHWKLVCTATMTHAALQLLFALVGLRVVPLRQWRLGEVGWWLFTVGTALGVLVLGTYFVARVFLNEYTATGGELEPFEIAAAVYTGVWGLAMVVGSPAGWRLRPPPGALLLSWLFWAIVLAIKWAFEYFLLVRNLVMPTLALWEGDYTCWEPGHTGQLPCSWDVGQGEHANHTYRATRDWFFRVVLILLRWSTPALVILADTMVVYMAVLSVASVVLAQWQRLGEPFKWSYLVSTFAETQQLFEAHLVSRTPQERRAIEKERAQGAEAEASGKGYAYKATSKEWRDFGFGWNHLVQALRSRDLLSNEERDELLFVPLGAPAHRAFFGDEYTALPTMLCAPLFVARDNKTLVAPSWTSYPWLGPVLLQLRDLTLFVLVSLGLVLEEDKDELVALITELAHHAMLCLDGHSVAEREYMLQLRKRLAALVAAVCRPPPPRLCSNSEARAAQ